MISQEEFDKLPTVEQNKRYKSFCQHIGWLPGQVPISISYLRELADKYGTPIPKMAMCPYCGGSGEIGDNYSPMSKAFKMIRKCQRCKGTGRLIEK